MEKLEKMIVENGITYVLGRMIFIIRIYNCRKEQIIILVSLVI